MASAFDFLLHSQNADGGWGYRVGGTSYVEPTAAVMLSLPVLDARGSDFLLSIQHRDGGWGIAAIDSESGWMTAWAVRALSNFLNAHDALQRGVSWLIETEGLRVTEPSAREQARQTLRIDSTLRGWAWQIGDAAWVHPTALAMLALVAANQRDHRRVREGVQYLFDRAVPSGGWNIGNPWMLDKQIPATIQDTAVVLLALRAANVVESEERVAKALQYLQNAIARAQTPAELAWDIYALKMWQIDTGDATKRLNALQKANGSWNDNPFITAIAVASQK